jgi:hypothetical protein
MLLSSMVIEAQYITLPYQDSYLWIDLLHAINGNICVLIGYFGFVHWKFRMTWLQWLFFASTLLDFIVYCFILRNGVSSELNPVSQILILIILPPTILVNPMLLGIGFWLYMKKDLLDEILIQINTVVPIRRFNLDNE